MEKKLSPVSRDAINTAKKRNRPLEVRFTPNPDWEYVKAFIKYANGKRVEVRFIPNVQDKIPE